ncbi:glutathione S-transferase N-terminal domain-containing protein [Alteromonas sp. 5E99-2]|uniref:glutaredoxin family protein n=1 Tax=Alteromonas sp. 5E99-2 TaxID=2817683 RepID=UPI001A9A0AE3|nr:glutathione S-transferase N-terminal domain-containing protein [Alteromonas sp. 5E99-2]MBO1255539.1 glutathione S-transferase N-terminal domain-containing protein [Alteromonas sp. 5E99-2]
MSKELEVQGLTLYHFSACMFCIKVRFFLWRKGIKVSQKDILIHPQYAQELIAGGGKKQVPCLRIESENTVQWLYESTDIINYFKSKLKNG